MRVIGLLNWYSEKPSWLAASVSSMSKLCDHVVAVDGAYGGFPTIDHRSSPEEVDTILRTADGLGMGWTVHVPKEKWWGGEVEKRSAMFRLGSQVADEGDWFLVLDADEVLQDVWAGTRTLLAETEHDVAEIGITDEWNGIVPIRRLFRALPEIAVEQAHYVVTAVKDGQKVVLCGDRKAHVEEAALPLLDVRIRHRNNEREEERKRQKAEYYAFAMPIEQRALEAFNGGQAGTDQGLDDGAGRLRVPSGSG